MDKEFLKKYNLTESQKKFQKLYEYTFITSPLSEDDDEDNADAQDGQDQQSQQPSQEVGGEETAQQDPQFGGGVGQQEAPQGSQGMPGQDAGDMSQNDSGLGGAIDNIENGETDNNSQSDSSSDNSDEEVIDVDDLTKAQDETEDKVDFTNKKLSQVMSKIDSFINAIKANDEKINDLAREVKDRMPTEDEKLNLRSQASYPYTIKPRDYWDEKSKNSNYDVMYDNDINPADEDEYVIKKDDLSNGNPKAIYDTFNDIEDAMDLNRIFNF